MTDIFNRLINICKTGDLSDVPTIHELAQIDIRSQNDILIKTLCDSKHFNILYWLLDLGKLLDSPYDLDSLLIVLIPNMDEQTIDIFFDCITTYNKKCEQEENNKKLLEEENNRKLLEEENNRKLLEGENNRKLLEEENNRKLLEKLKNENISVSSIKELTGGDRLYSRKLFGHSIDLPQLNIPIFGGNINSSDGWHRVKMVNFEPKFREFNDSSDTTDEDMPELEDDVPELEYCGDKNCESIPELDEDVLIQNMEKACNDNVDELFIDFLKLEKQKRDELTIASEPIHQQSTPQVLQQWCDKVDDYKKSQEEFKQLVKDLLNIDEFAISEIENKKYNTQEEESDDAEYQNTNEESLATQCGTNNTVIETDNLSNNIGTENIIVVENNKVENTIVENTIVENTIIESNEYDTYKLPNAYDTRKKVIGFIIEGIISLIGTTSKMLNSSCEYKLTNEQSKYYDELKNILTHHHYVVWAVSDLDNNKAIHIEW